MQFDEVLRTFSSFFARARKLRPMTTESYLEWLTLMRVNPARREINSDSDEPFEL